MVLALVPVLAPDWRFGFAGAAAAVLMLVQEQVLALDRRFCFAGAAALLMLAQALALDQRFAGVAAVVMLVQAQVLALDRCFGFAGAAAGLMLVLDRRFVLLVLVLAQAPALDRRFVLSCQGWNRHVMPRMTSD